MENEFKFSKQYARIFAEAKRIGNIQEMERCFNELCSEVGAPNEEMDKAGAEMGRRIAERQNAAMRGEGGKKI